MVSERQCPCHLPSLTDIHAHRKPRQIHPEGNSHSFVITSGTAPNTTDCGRAEVQEAEYSRSVQENGESDVQGQWERVEEAAETKYPKPRVRSGTSRNAKSESTRLSSTARPKFQLTPLPATQNTRPSPEGFQNYHQVTRQFHQPGLWKRRVHRPHLRDYSKRIRAIQRLHGDQRPLV